MLKLASSVGGFLNRFWPLILGLAVGGWIVHQSYSLGYDSGKQEQLIAQQELALEYQIKAADSERIYSDLLLKYQAQAKQNESFNQSQSVSLAKSNQEQAQRAAQIRKEVTHAVNQDVVGSCVGGLGSSGLRLYKRALGYTD